MNPQNYFLCPQPGPLVDVGVELEPSPPELELADLPHPPPPPLDAGAEGAVGMELEPPSSGLYESD